MDRQILLLRGVNVGGVKLPMAAFRAMLGGLGLVNVRSYIQSGNVVFDDPGLPDLKAAIAGGLQSQFGLRPRLFFYAAESFDEIIRDCPYRAMGDADGARVYVFFLIEAADLDRAALQVFATTERFHLTQHALYLHAPDGIGRSVLVEKLARILKATTTARNWNTTLALSKMARSP